MVGEVAGLRLSHAGGQIPERAGQLSKTVTVGLCSNSREYVLTQLAISCMRP